MYVCNSNKMANRSHKIANNRNQTELIKYRNYE